MDKKLKLKRIIESTIKKQLKESYLSPTPMGQQIMDIVSDLSDKYLPNSVSGKDLLKISNRFIAALKRQGITNVPNDVLLDLEDNNFHTAIKIIVDNGMGDPNF